MIGIELNQPYYEQDIRPLLMSFFPGVPLKAFVGGEKDGQEELSACLSVFYTKTGAEVTWRERSDFWEDKEAYAHSERKEKHASDLESFTEETTSSQQMQVICQKRTPDFSLQHHKEGKNVVKRAVYTLLCDLTGHTLPWGSLTGIRPTKIAMTMAEQGASDEDILTHYREAYFCSEEKAVLSLEIAHREMEILKDIDYQNGYSLYIGIPFCPTTCLYCSFTSYPIGKWRSQVDAYLDCVFREIDYVAEAFADKKLNTIYFGGGTPTTLEADQLERLIVKVKESFDLTWLQEFTVEAGRPDSITREKLEVIKRQGISRISINPQTMKDETLKIIGRQHTVAQIRQVYQMAREAGLDNINMDIILGLPDETVEDVEHTMQALAELAPDNITVHSLAVKRAARLNTAKADYSQYHMENSDEMMAVAERYARMLGLEPYYLYRQKNMSGNLENVGYAKPGKAGIYNILIMEEKQTIVALGAGATTKAVFGDRIERCENVKDIHNYMDRIEEMIERKKKLFADV
ncbi:MAG: coproporphyrinogen dehydrogenase HemZ [Lachnospiraceae bacterium]|nr:coproporphyrinogen dehydrogenase HemZ [Lachnospiraceae bacterium]